MGNTRMPVGIVGFGVRALLSEELAERGGVEVRVSGDPAQTARARGRAPVPEARGPDARRAQLEAPGRGGVVR